MTLGQRIKQLRTEESLTQKEFAAEILIGVSTLACYETDRRTVPYDVLIKIALFFNVTTDYLLGLED